MLYAFTSTCSTTSTGLRKIGEDWKWESGKPFYFKDWGRNEPTNYVQEKCAVMSPKYFNGQWNDLDCVDFALPLCQKSTPIKNNNQINYYDDSPLGNGGSGNGHGYGYGYGWKWKRHWHWHMDMDMDKILVVVMQFIFISLKEASIEVARSDSFLLLLCAFVPIEL